MAILSEDGTETVKLVRNDGSKISAQHHKHVKEFTPATFKESENMGLRDNQKSFDNTTGDDEKMENERDADGHG